MKCKWKVCFLLMGELAFGCASAMAVSPLTGNWNLTISPTGKPIACINLTPPRIIHGKLAGTWSAPSSRGWWIQQGNGIGVYVDGQRGRQATVTLQRPPSARRIYGKFFVSPRFAAPFVATRRNGACP